MDDQQSVKPLGGAYGTVQGRGNVEQKKDGSIQAPERIIVTPAAARQYYQNYKTNHIPRIRLYSAVEGLISGNPPFDTAKLAEAGLQHITNVNTLDAKAKVEKACLTFWNLLNQTENLVVFTIHPFEIEQEDLAFDEWAEILARNWTKVIREQWPGFITQTNMLTFQLIKFGLSPLIWPDEQDFRWETIDVSRFFVADDTTVDIDKWDYVFVESTFTVQYLYKVYERMKAKKNDDDSPWNVDALAQFLLDRANLVSKESNKYDNMLAVEQAIGAGSFSGASFTDSVRLVSLYYKEYSGKITHCIFDPNSSHRDEFLFEVPEQYMNFHEAIVAFTYSPGEFYLHGNKGVGHKIFPVCQALMQMHCHMFDMVKLSATPLFRTAGGVGKDAQPIRLIPGTANDIGQSELVQNQTGQNVDKLVSVANYFENLVNKNVAMSGDDPSTPDADRGSKSAPEAMMQAVKEFSPGKQNVEHFYTKFDIVVRQMAAKMFHSKAGYACYDIVKKWKDACILEGVPLEIFELNGAERNELPVHISVRASRVAGDGSDLGLIVGLNGIAGIAGGFGAKGQYNYRKDIIKSRLGNDYVGRYLSDSQEPDESAGGASLAMLENVAIKMGETPLVTKDNQHRSHIGVHLAGINQTIQQVQSQELDPVSADKIFALSIPHTGEHIQILSQDALNRQFIEEITPSWRQINKFAQLNRVKAQKMRQAEVRRRAEEEQQMSVDMMEQDRKDQIANREQNRKDQESAIKADRAKQQSETRGEIQRTAVEKKAENDRRRIELEAQNEARKNEIRDPKEILAGESTSALQSTLRGQVGRTPNPADFE